MATTYKTPGVYVEEIVKFPPSVAQVETAIPAFIGYTEKATSKMENDLHNLPTRITSLLEYEAFYGFAYAETTITVKITDTLANETLKRDIVVNQPLTPQPYLMYYAMQMYFANGGGPCYIVSVNTYETAGVANAIDSGELNGGLNLLRAEDEPTLILFPDAKNLSDSLFYALYGNALMQCHDMQDRFTIIDTYRSSDVKTDSDLLRLKIGLEKDYLKYGAVYYPFLETILNYRYDEDTIKIKHLSYQKDAVPLAKEQIIALKTGLNGIIKDLKDITDEDAATVHIDTVKGSIHDVFDYIENPAGFKNSVAGSETFTVAKKTAFIVLLDKMITGLDDLITGKKQIKAAATSAIESVEENNAADDDIVAALNDFISFFEGAGKIEDVTKKLKDLSQKLKIDSSNAEVLKSVKTGGVNVIAEAKKLLAYSPVLNFPQETLAVTKDAFSDLSSKIDTLIAKVDLVTDVDKNNGFMNGRFLGEIPKLDNVSYNAIKAGILNLPVTLPPSSAMAGIYARVDANRGVWKAPANVGVNYVVRPSMKITNTDQDGLNIDTTAGKSINAIRNFTGKGTLVWGARTLAGNDNEWRYVPVRRFFNMAEESIRKATEQFVFEPNDANTWIRVRAMIENFLTLQWRAGALAGAKPDQAFYVRVGLGQTMSADDILNGYMIIEIGMAVVRPAEFIILKFSHKMQEA